MSYSTPPNESLTRTAIKLRAETDGNYYEERNEQTNPLAGIIQSRWLR